ncbi:MAG TPA: hypothetical protein VII64_07695, partial [Thermodesulfobacteriota bacterium]
DAEGAEGFLSGRLLKKAHLLCYLCRSSVRRTAKSTPPSSLLDASHLDLFEQPEQGLKFLAMTTF